MRRAQKTVGAMLSRIKLTSSLSPNPSILRSEAVERGLRLESFLNRFRAAFEFRRWNRLRCSLWLYVRSWGHRRDLTYASDNFR